jgi:hypothetical protein
LDLLVIGGDLAILLVRLLLQMRESLLEFLVQVVRVRLELGDVQTEFFRFCLAFG